jgi:hypothetical protein
MKNKMYTEGKGKGGLHIAGSSKGEMLLGTKKPPSNTKNRPSAKGVMTNKGPEVRLGKNNKGNSSLRGTK